MAIKVAALLLLRSVTSVMGDMQPLANGSNDSNGSMHHPHDSNHSGMPPPAFCPPNYCLVQVAEDMSKPDSFVCEQYPETGYTCSFEGAPFGCNCNGEAAYGLPPDLWFNKTLTEETACSKAGFGEDPVSNEGKLCHCMPSQMPGGSDLGHDCRPAHPSPGLTSEGHHMEAPKCVIIKGISFGVTMDNLKPLLQGAMAVPSQLAFITPFLVGYPLDLLGQGAGLSSAIGNPPTAVAIDKSAMSFDMRVQCCRGPRCYLHECIELIKTLRNETHGIGSGENDLMKAKLLEFKEIATSEDPDAMGDIGGMLSLIAYNKLPAPTMGTCEARTEAPTAGPSTAAPSTEAPSETSTEASTEAPATVPSVKVELTVAGLDYTSFIADESAVAQMTDDLKTEILSYPKFSNAGYVKEDITITYSDGSVKAEVEIATKAGTDLSDVAAVKDAVTEQASTLKQKVETLATALPSTLKDGSTISAGVGTPVEVTAAPTTVATPTTATPANNVGSDARMSAKIQALALILVAMIASC